MIKSKGFGILGFENPKVLNSTMPNYNYRPMSQKLLKRIANGTCIFKKS